MAHYPPARREFLKLSACAAVAFPGLVAATGITGRAATANAPAYDPQASFDVEVTEVEMRRNRARPDADGPRLPAQGPRPVPGAARSARRRLEQQGSQGRGADGSRTRRQRRAGRGHRPDPCARVAVSGVGAGCQLRRALAEVEGRRLERRRVAVGIYGSSSGGHVAQLLAMRPHDPRYNAIRSPRRRRSTPPWPTWRCARRSAIPTPATRTRCSTSARA